MYQSIHKPRRARKSNFYFLMSFSTEHIHILCGIIYIILSIFYIKGFKCIHEFVLPGRGKVMDGAFMGLYCLIGICFTFYLVKYIFEHRAMRRILESGFLSIQSCAVVWRLVILAHLRAVEEGFEQKKEYREYTRRLVENACVIRKNLFKIHETILKNEWPDENKQSRVAVPAQKQADSAILYR